MKKIILLLLLSIPGFCQITVTGTGNSEIDGHTFNLYNSTTGISAWCMSPDFLYDTGTNIYRTPTANPNDFYYIIRRNGHWIIELNYGSGAAWRIKFRSALPSTDNDPPCTTSWEIWDGICFSYGSNNHFTGSSTNSILLSGANCNPSVPLSASTINPNVINLPQQPTSQINAITSPVHGMITFDIDENCIKFFNGQEWVCIYNDLGHLTSKGDLLLKNNGDVILGETGSGLGEYLTGSYGPTNNGIRFYTNNTDRVRIENNGFISVNPNTSPAKSTLDVRGSQNISVLNAASSTTLDETMHTVIYTGSGNDTFTFPNALNLTGREYFLTNHSGGAMLFSTSVTTGLSSTITHILPGTSIHIVSDGSVWRKIN